MSDLRLIVQDVGELVFTLTGEPGNRAVRVTRNDGVPYGSVSYARVMYPDCSGVLAPFGDVISAKESDLACLTAQDMDELRYWAEHQALGIAATGEEAYE